LCERGPSNNLRTSCDDCGPGTQYSNHSKGCEACKAGKYANGVSVITCIDCQVDTFTSKISSSVCNPCSSPLTTKGTGATTCDACEKLFFMNQAGTCDVCPEHTTCDKVGNKLGSLWIEHGFYRHSVYSDEVQRCKVIEACM